MEREIEIEIERLMKEYVKETTYDNSKRQEKETGWMTKREKIVKNKRKKKKGRKIKRESV
jgi:hypothetical protein